jgi:hypothetical protein
MANERRVWLAVVYPIGHAEIFGGAWDRDHLHWTREAAEREAPEMASDLGLAPVQWTKIDEVWAIGRCHKIGDETDLYGVTVRAVQLPSAEGKPRPRPRSRRTIVKSRPSSP